MDLKHDMNVWSELNWRRIGKCGRFFVHGCVPSDSVKGGEFLDYVRAY
jgi:hypothetical protein